jgi:hypothetical protein
MSERNSEIIRLWNEDKSASQVAGILGLTRNIVISVITKARSKGLITRPKLASNRLRGAHGQAILRNQRRNTEKKATSLPKLFVREKKGNEDAAAVGVPFLELDLNGCRYPTSRFGGQHFFCGEPRRDTRTSYCEQHHALCWYQKKKMTESEMLKLKTMYAKRAWMQSKGSDR